MRTTLPFIKAESKTAHQEVDMPIYLFFYLMN